MKAHASSKLAILTALFLQSCSAPPCSRNEVVVNNQLSSPSGVAVPCELVPGADDFTVTLDDGSTLRYSIDATDGLPVNGACQLTWDTFEDLTFTVSQNDRAVIIVDYSYTANLVDVVATTEHCIGTADEQVALFPSAGLPRAEAAVSDGSSSLRTGEEGLLDLDGGRARVGVIEANADRASGEGFAYVYAVLVAANSR